MCLGHRHEEAPIDLEAVESEGINLIWRIEVSDEAVAISTSPVAPRDQDVPVTRRPFALDPDEVRNKIENEVVTSAFSHRPKDLDAKEGCPEGDSHLGDGSFLIRCHARQPTDPIGWAVSGSDTPAAATIPLAQKGHKSL